MSVHNQSSRILVGAFLLSFALIPTSLVFGQESDKSARSYQIDEDGQVTEDDGRDEALDAPTGQRTEVLRSLLQDRLSGRGYLGLKFSELSPELREHFGAPRDAGVLVSQLEEGSPAQKAGVTVGDVLTAINGKPIEFGMTLQQEVRSKESGTTVDLEIFRSGRPQTLLVELGERAPGSALAFRPMLDGRLRVSPLFEGAGAPGLGINMDEALSQLDNFFGSDQWLETLQGLEGIDLANVEDRMRQVEQRMRELESQLESQGKEPEE